MDITLEKLLDAARALEISATKASDMETPETVNYVKQPEYNRGELVINVEMNFRMMVIVLRNWENATDVMNLDIMLDSVRINSILIQRRVVWIKKGWNKKPKMKISRNTVVNQVYTDNTKCEDESSSDEY